jgi:hypothetical protein
MSVCVCKGKDGKRRPLPDSFSKSCIKCGRDT